jgi:hypothetical protein
LIDAAMDAVEKTQAAALHDVEESLGRLDDTIKTLGVTDRDWKAKLVQAALIYNVCSTVGGAPPWVSVLLDESLGPLVSGRLGFTSTAITAACENAAKHVKRWVDHRRSTDDVDNSDSEGSDIDGDDSKTASNAKKDD